MSFRPLWKASHLLIAALMLAQTARPQRPAGPPAQAQPPAPPIVAHFPSGETLSYAISWRLFTAGEARMHIESHPVTDGSVPHWQASISVISTGFVSLLYKVEDTMVSNFENTRSGLMCSISLVKTLNEGRRHRETHIDFQRDRKVAVIKETDLAKGQVLRQAENPIPACAYDVISALYYVRSMPLEVGRNFEIQVNDGGKTLPIIVEVQAKEEVKTNAGTFRAVRVEPKVFGGTLFRRSGRMLIWFSDDPQRLLLQLKAKLFVGTISAILQQVEHK